LMRERAALRCVTSSPSEPTSEPSCGSTSYRYLTAGSSSSARCSDGGRSRRRAQPVQAASRASTYRHRYQSATRRRTGCGHVQTQWRSFARRATASQGRRDESTIASPAPTAALSLR